MTRPGGPSTDGEPRNAAVDRGPAPAVTDGGSADAAVGGGDEDAPQTGPETVDIEAVHGAFWGSFGFVSDHVVSVVALSLAWTIASLPLITVGPATLCVYAAVTSIRETGSIDRGAVVSTLRDHGLDAVLLGGVVVALAGVSLLYLEQFLRSGAPLAGVLGVAGLYVTFHLVLVLAPTFVGLSRGESLSAALATGYRWTLSNSFAAVTTLFLTGLLFVVSAALTVAFVLVFPAITAWFHADLLDPLFAAEPETVSGAEDRSGSAGYAEPRDG
jgi:hypothetical protein